MELEDILYPVHPLLIKILRRILHLSAEKCWIRYSVICIFTHVNIAKRLTYNTNAKRNLLRIFRLVDEFEVRTRLNFDLGLKESRILSNYISTGTSDLFKQFVQQIN